MSLPPSVSDLGATIPIELSKIGEFVRAIGDDNPIHLSLAAAQRSGFERVPAPLTYTTVVNHFRPPEQQGLHAILTAIGVPWSAPEPVLLLGESRWNYHLHPLVGDILIGSTRLASIRDLARRDGSSMREMVLRTSWIDATGTPSISEDQVILELAAHPRKTLEEVPGPEDSGTQSSSLPLRTFGPLSRVDIARYAGATGSFGQIHLDEPYAQAHGHPTVFSTGPHHAGQLAAVVSQSIPLSSITALRVRYVSRVWPGDLLHFTQPKPTGTYPGEFGILARNQGGAVCVRGWVTVL